MKRITIISNVLITIMFMSCNDNSFLILPTQKYSSSFSGKVILQNQTEHSNALVYVDILNRGVSTDSSGNYIFQFTEQDSIYCGEFKVYYFLNDYDMDSAKIMLVKGKVILDALDIDSEGKKKTKELKQILRVEGWTDKQEYYYGEKITFTARFTNVTNRMVRILIRAQNQLGSVGLYYNYYNNNYYVTLSSCDPVSTDSNIFLQPTHFYEGKVVYTISKQDCTSFPWWEPREYIVITTFMIDGRKINPYINKYIENEWRKIHRGTLPKLNYIPNKYNFPHIKIIR